MSILLYDIRFYHTIQYCIVFTYHIICYNIVLYTTISHHETIQYHIIQYNMIQCHIIHVWPDIVSLYTISYHDAISFFWYNIRSRDAIYFQIRQYHDVYCLIWYGIVLYFYNMMQYGMLCSENVSNHLIQYWIGI